MLRPARSCSPTCLHPLHADGDSPFEELRVRLIDPNEYLDENEKWSKLYDEPARRALSAPPPRNNGTSH